MAEAYARAFGAPRAEVLEDSIVEVRQWLHVRDLDLAYFDGYQDLRRVEGVETVADAMSGTYGPYLAFRRELLKEKLLDEHTSAGVSGQYKTGNRFMLGGCGGLEADVRHSAVVDTLPADASFEPSYMAWRRLLLQQRYEKRLGFAVDNVIKEIALRKLQEAEEARAREEGLLEDPEKVASKEAERMAANPLVWRIHHQFDMQGEDFRLHVAAGGAAGARDVTRTSSGAFALSTRSGGAAAGGGVSEAGSQARGISAMAFAHNDNDNFAVAMENGTAYLCSARAGKRWATLAGHTGAITAIDWSVGVSETYVVTVSSDRTARLWLVTLPTLERVTITSPTPAPGAGAQRLRSSPAVDTGSEGSTDGASPSTTGSGAPTTPQHRGGLDRAAELARAKREMEVDAERARATSYGASAWQLTGGSAVCVRMVTTDFPLTHVRFWPLNSNLFVCAGVEEADLDAEAAVEAAELNEGGGGGGGVVSPPTASTSVARGVMGASASLLSKGLKGSVAAVRAVGDVTFGAIEAVPMVGTAVGMTVNMIKKGVNVARRRERRGHLLIINASLGRTLQTRKITSARGSSAVKAPATVTAMTFAPNGHQLFVADARGAVHMFTVEADVVKQQVKPLRSHAIVWGEGAASFTSLASPIRQSTSAAYSGAGGGSLRAQSGRVDEGAASSESASIHLTSLSYRPLDSALRCPLLIGMDNTGHLRALRLQPPTYAEPKPAAGGVVKTGARVAVGAMGAVTGAISIPTSMVATEVAYIMYTAGLPTNLSDVTGASLSSIGSGAFGSFGSNAFIGVGMTRASSTSSTGSGSSGGGSGRPLSLSSAAASTVHTAFAVCHNLDALFVGTPSGEMYLLLAHPPAADRSLAAKLVARGVSPGGMLMPGRLATLGCGVAPTQVASKMRGHVNAISSLALNKDEDVLVSCDASGVLLVWERMPLAKAEATGGAVGYIFDESSRESASSSIGSSSSFAQRHASGSSIGRASSAHAPPAGASTSPSQGSLGAPPRAPGGALRMLPTSWMRGGR